MTLDEPKEVRVLSSIRKHFRSVQVFAMGACARAAGHEVVKLELLFVTCEGGTP
jgi:hypothetical protein